MAAEFPEPPPRLPPALLDPGAVARAIEVSMAAYWLSLGRGGGVVHDGPDLKWAYTGRPVLNRVVGARLDARDADARIADVLRRFGAWHAGVTWLTGPTDQPTDLARRLEAHGFVYQESWVDMALHLGSTGESGAAVRDAGGLPGFVVREVVDDATLAAWRRIIRLAFQLPRAAAGLLARRPDQAGPAGPGDASWRRYVGFLAGRSVCTAAVVTARAAPGVAGLYLVGTAPEARGRGLGTAMTRHVLAEAQDCGQRLVVLQATAAARDLYRRLGFQEYGAVRVYRWQPPRRAGPWGLPRRWAAHLYRLWSHPHQEDARRGAGAAERRGERHEAWQGGLVRGPAQPGRRVIESGGRGPRLVAAW